MTRTPWGTRRSVWSESNAPFTLALIVITSLVCLLSFFQRGSTPIASYLSFDPSEDFRQPWRLFTYPLSCADPFGMLFYGLMLWWIGASLERSWGTKFYASFFAAMTAITAIGMTLGYFLLHVPVTVGYYLPMSAVFFAWCCINPEQELRIYAIIPVLAKWLAVVEVFVIFFTYGQINPFMGIFALMGCGAAFAWVKMRAWDKVNLYQTTPRRWDSDPEPRRPRLRVVPPKATKPKDDRFTIRDLNPLEWFAKRRRRKQFEKLMNDD